jgi:hypothetical protein
VSKAQALPQATSSQAGVGTQGAGLSRAVAGVFALVPVPFTFWVHPTGSDDAGDGSQGNPYRTLGKAFAVIAAGSSTLGWVVMLPPGVWEENVGLPPPNTTLRGAGSDRTLLRGPGAAALTWTESGNPGARALEDLALFANLTGEDGGNLPVRCTRVAPAGTFTNLARLVFDGCSSLPTLVNQGALLIRNHQTPTPPALSFTYDPVTATNGAGPLGSRVEGGAWGAVLYEATDPGADLELVGVRATSIETRGQGIARVRSSRVVTLLRAQDASSQVEYDGPLVDELPAFTGAGVLRPASLLLRHTFLAGFVEGDVTLALPNLGGLVDASAVFTSLNKPGGEVSFVSSTATSLTLHVKPPTGAPAFQLRALVCPS